jgi:hypothetical protein
MLEPLSRDHVAQLGAVEAFFNGYQEGYLYFKVHHHRTPFTTTQLVGLLKTRMQQKPPSNDFQAGFLTGWYAAFFERAAKVSQKMHPLLHPYYLAPSEGSQSV